QPGSAGAASQPAAQPQQPQPYVVPPIVVASGEIGPARVSKRDGRTFWFDLTNSLEWRGGVVGIVRAELEIAYGLRQVDPSVRFSMHKGNGFVEVPEAQLAWLFEADNVVDAYLVYDIILLRSETRHIYSEHGQNKFVGYVKWISANADFMLFGRETAK
ncbi:hypothetical protein, partial [Burkholderia gladioli]|uniref:hypothetical protein n=1 Tax=Burkholderia gladioli TaxID=28095 RepID=UPI001ABB266C